MPFSQTMSTLDSLVVIEHDHQTFSRASGMSYSHLLAVLESGVGANLKELRLNIVVKQDS